VEKVSHKRSIMVGAVTGAIVGIATAAVAAVVTLTTSYIGEGIVASTPCDSSFTVEASAPGWDAATGTFVVSQVAYSGIDPTACSGEFLRVEVVDAANTSLGSAGGIVGGSGSGTLALTSNVPVDDIDRIAAAIYTP
jgi:hypothetical protein